jgi:hypothetical protein
MITMLMVLGLTTFQPYYAIAIDTEPVFDHVDIGFSEFKYQMVPKDTLGMLFPGDIITVLNAKDGLGNTLWGFVGKDVIIDDSTKCIVTGWSLLRSNTHDYVKKLERK